MSQPEFLPATREEMSALGWDELDILLISGDAYVDSHSFGAALLGRWLLAHGYRTGIVAQPGWENAADVARMGRPRLFAGVTAGAMDSLLAHYTAFRKKRGQDAYSPGGAAGLRPNRATLVYAGLVRQAFPGLPVVAGGIEASLRRASHYDFWSDSLRRSIVLDSKADAVLYGMGEKSILAVAELFSRLPARQRPGEAFAAARLPGTAYAVHPDAIPADAEELPSHEAIIADPALLIKATMAFERQMLRGAPPLAQRSGGRAVVFEPPRQTLTQEEMDEIYGLPFTRRAHPSYSEEIPAAAMLEGSVTSHRGCGGGCSFCALASHQGRLVQSRSAGSVLREIGELTKRPDWKGSVTDIGGPSSNMWNAACTGDSGACARESCLYPKRCRHFKADQEGQADLLREAAGMDGVKHVRAASGVRHDLALDCDAYLRALVGEFAGGQLKIAPEHVSEKVLRLMRKPPVKLWQSFIRAFDKLSKEAGKEQYIVPYLMSAFPGCTDQDMEELAAWLKLRRWRPQQVQCFIPTPGTVATAMFYARQDTEGRPIQVARTDAERLRQHRILLPDAEPAPHQPAPERKTFEKRPFPRGGKSGPRDRFNKDRPARDGKPGSDPRGAFGKPRFERGDRPPGDSRDRFAKGKPGGKPGSGPRDRFDKDRPARDGKPGSDPRGAFGKPRFERGDRPTGDSRDRFAKGKPGGKPGSGPRDRFGKDNPQRGGGKPRPGGPPRGFSGPRKPGRGGPPGGRRPKP